MRTFDCAELTDLAPELAVGNVCGEERAAAFAHLASCASCQQVVNSYTTVTDRLLLLTRRVEPPAGFEQRVLAALPTDRPTKRRHSRPRRRRSTLLAAVAAAVLTFGAGGLLVDVGLHDEPAFASADMTTASGDVVGQVFVHEDGRPSLFMTLPGWSQPTAPYGTPNAHYLVRIETTDGRVLTEPISLSNESTWAATLDLDVDTVTNVAVVDAAGHIWCQAQFD